MPDLDAYLLRAFVSVADIGTVSGAAAQLHRSQAVVSLQVRRLEELVGSPLFERSTKGLSLNADGLLLLPYAREMLRMNDEAQQRLRGHRVEGRIKLGMVEDFAASRIVGLLKAFRNQNPQVQMDMRVMGNQQLAGLLDEEGLDLVICDAGLVSRRPEMLWHEQLLWVIRSDLCLSNSKEGLPIVLFEASCPWRERVVAALSQRDLHWHLACEASTLVAMSTAVQVGVGIGPMMAATIPPGCHSLGRGPGLPAPVPIDIGLYASSRASSQARFLAEFLARAAEDAPSHAASTSFDARASLS